jgi:hypothetical protein
MEPKLCPSCGKEHYGEFPLCDDCWIGYEAIKHQAESDLTDDFDIMKGCDGLDSERGFFG